MSNNNFQQQHRLFRQTVRDFVKTELLPNVDVWENQGYVPKSVFKKMGGTSGRKG